MKGWQLLIGAVVLWALLSWGTQTMNPIESISNLIAQADEVIGATRLTHETEDASGNVASSPEALAAEASQTLGQSVGVEEYALARMLRCERTPPHKNGNDGEGAAIVWVCLNDAAAHDGGDIIRCLTNGRGFGKQIGRKYATGRADPYDRDLDLVRRCLSGAIPDPTGGRTHFMHRDGFKTRALYEAAVAKWSGYGWQNSGLDFNTSLEVWT